MNEKAAREKSKAAGVRALSIFLVPRKANSQPVLRVESAIQILLELDGVHDTTEGVARPT